MLEGINSTLNPGMINRKNSIDRTILDSIGSETTENRTKRGSSAMSNRSGRSSRVVKRKLTKGKSSARVKKKNTNASSL
jgi:hypothetical protein